MTYTSDNIQRKVKIRIPMHDKPISYSNLQIHQEMLSHCSFEFLWNIFPDLETNPQQDLNYFFRFLDTEISISLFTSAGKEVLFKGLITDMEIENTGGVSIGFLIKGKSHTIAMEDLLHSRMHLDKSLQDIIKEAMNGHIMGLWEPEDILPEYTQKIRSSMQSNETDWSYLTRLAQQYGEWFYWDGKRLQIGRLKPTGMTLKNGMHIRHFRIKVRLNSNRSGLSSYDYKQAAPLVSEQDQTQNHYSSELLYAGLEGQRTQYCRRFDETKPYQYYTPVAENREIIEQMNVRSTSGKASRMVVFSGKTEEPINIGSVITIEDKGVLHGAIITKCCFFSVGTGNLSNTFEAIPADCIHPPYTDPLARGFAYSQPATVIDNNDPEGMGRLRVQYFWNAKTQENKSDWIRVQTSYAGKDKGIYWTPEIGEEVRVSFEGNHPDAPYISGSNYNGKDKSGVATPGNDFKIIKTRSGHYLEFEELKNIKLGDQKGNLFHIDSIGDALNIEALKTITIKAPNIYLTATENVITTAGQDIIQTAEGELRETADSKTEITEGKNTAYINGHKLEIAQKITISATADDLLLNGAKDIKINRDEKSNMF